MKKIDIGKHGHESVFMDIDILLRTRLLIQANSGGGKSWVIRLICEKLFGKVPTIIIDPEGEFASLREKFGYVLVGKGGETPADVRSAQLVAHRLLELRASAVCDIYELKPATRHAWVRLFLEAMIDAPKNLWRPTIVVVDEAHVYIPEKGQGESEAFGAMQDIVTRGRKRGFGSIFATQRLSKLSKNASAEMLNRLVGQTFEDIDLERAADLLSVPRGDREQFFREMKVIEPGNFWALGRAIAKDRTLVKIGSVLTTHPEPGKSYSEVPPPPPEKVRALLPKLSDLPKEADQKAHTEAELRSEIRSLKARIAAPSPAKIETVVQQKTVEVPVLKKRQINALERNVEGLRKIYEGMTYSIKSILDAAKSMENALSVARAPRKDPPAPLVPKPMPVAKPIVPVDGEDISLLAGERRMLQVLAQFHPGSRTRAQLGALAGYTPSGGTFGNYFGRLKRFGLLVEEPDGIRLTEKGLEFFQGAMPRKPSSPQEVLEMWRGKLLAGERKMLDIVVAAWPGVVTREALGQEAGYQHTGGTFGNYLGTLRRNALVLVQGDNVKASDSLCE